MIDTKIFQAGATSIKVEVSVWKRDKMTPAKFKCTIIHENNTPEAVVAERDSALAAERECVEHFIAMFGKKERRIHSVTKNARPVDPGEARNAEKPLPTKPKRARPADDDFEY